MTSEYRAKPEGEESDTQSVKSDRSLGRTASGSNSHHSSRAQSPLIHNPRLPSKNASGMAEEAPMGYEPVGSAHDMSPYSERSTPPYMEWARDLKYVLEDYTGFKLFKLFLEQEACVNALDFYFGVKALYEHPASELDSIKQLADLIYVSFIRRQGERYLGESEGVRAATRDQIRQTMHRRDKDAACLRGAFDDAVRDVTRFLRMKHAAFAESDIYLEFVRRKELGVDHESQSSSSSTSGEPPRPPAAFLAPVQEEDFDPDLEEVTVPLENVKIAGASSSDRELSSASSSELPPPVPPRLNNADPAATMSLPRPVSADAAASAQNQFAAGSSTTLPLSKPVSQPVPQSSASTSGNPVQQQQPQAGLPAFSSPDTPAVTAKKKPVAQPAAPPPQPSQSGKLTPKTLEATYMQRFSTLSKSTRGGARMPPNPYHTNYVPRLPPSTQDSELQSMSSENADNSSFADTSLLGEFPLRQSLMAKRQQQRDKALKHEQSRRNQEADKVIPRTMRETGPPQIRPDGDNDQQLEFARQLIEKLKILEAKREMEEKFQKSLLEMSEPAEPPRSKQELAKRAAAQAAAALQKYPADMDDTHILDDHLAHIGWDDSAKHSPRRSPGLAPPLFYPPHAPAGRRRSPLSKSPDRWGGHQGRGAALMTTSFPSASTVPTLQPPQAAAAHTTESIGRKPKQPFLANPGFAAAKQQPKGDKQPLGQQRLNKAAPSAAAKRETDTSGISSGSCSSSGPSLVSAFAPPPDKSAPRPRNPAAPRKAAPPNTLARLNAPNRRQWPSEPTEQGEGGRGQWRGGAPPELPVSYFLPDETVPYVVRHSGADYLTLEKFKTLLPRRYQEGAGFKYFFKCPSDLLEVGGLVWVAVTDDKAHVPLWKGKIVAKIESAK